jgi:hypothetical protein
MQVTGILVYEDLEGGFWGIVGEDGSRYELDVNPPRELAQAGLMVRADLEPSHEVSIRQWGNPVQLVRITRVDE